MSNTPNTADIPALCTYLGARLMENPRLQEALQQVSPAPLSDGRGTPKARVFITTPYSGGYGDPWLQRDYFQIGVKLTYPNSTGYWEQFGQIMHVSTLEGSFLKRCVSALAAGLADGILKHEESKKPLPTRPLTAQARAELEVPF